MTISDFLSELELDYSWREEEIRFHQNTIASIHPSNQDKFRRSTMLVIYAHFEGYVKFCFQHYINMVNSLNAKCRDVSFPIAAASLHNVFADLDRINSKSAIFKDTLPNDSNLHRMSRQAEFLKRIDDINNIVIEIPDNVADTESNLKPTVLKKLLYEVGLDHKLFEHLETSINRLLRIRNDIAHGGSKFKRGIDIRDYETLRDMAFTVMSEVKSTIINAVNNGDFIR